ncbi:hypothetical protein OE230_03200 [Levilactobacillus brevis]|nr:hypothetical protein OE230_03200 [Levilactobacillus brevis]
MGKAFRNPDGQVVVVVQNVKSRITVYLCRS